LLPSVSELIIAQLLYLNQQGSSYDQSLPITFYINSQGTNAPENRPYSFDTEAFAIADTMLFIKCPIRTICIGQAYGTAAMLLALGSKGHRYALPNAQIMLHQPKGRAHGQASDIAIKAKEIVANRQVTNSLIAQACGKEFNVVERDSSRACYLSPEEAVAYGLIDKVLLPDGSGMLMKGGSAVKIPANEVRKLLFHRSLKYDDCGFYFLFSQRPKFLEFL
jgi:ATP-dependent Clp protease protease subunit